MQKLSNCRSKYSEQIVLRFIFFKLPEKCTERHALTVTGLGCCTLESKDPLFYNCNVRLQFPLKWNLCTFYMLLTVPCAEHYSLYWLFIFAKLMRLCKTILLPSCWLLSQWNLVVSIYTSMFKTKETSEFYPLPYLCVRYDSDNKQRLFQCTKFFAVEVHYVFCEVRTEYLYTM